jgi:hypothetical protein
MSYTWSFSSYKQYVNCPKQYQEIKVLKRFFVKPTQEMTYGNEVHKALEHYVKDGTPLAKNYERFKALMDTLMEIDGEKHPELRMALDRDGNASEYGKGYWVRGIVDLLITEGDLAHILDYKTGSSKYPDTKQLKLMALMTFAKFPQINRVKAGLLFVMHDAFTTEEYTRDQIPALWDAFKPDLMRMDASYNTDVWNPNPTPLCGWCPVTTCDFYKERR